jgi:two-component system osmolarity sensor histidine kinase EnvZ
MAVLRVRSYMAFAYDKLLAMTALGQRALPAWRHVRDAWPARLEVSALPASLRRLAARFADVLPKGLYARALIIIIAPIVLLESVVAFSFMERHWQSVTRRLSEATARDIAALIDVYESYSLNDDYAKLFEMARERLGLSMQILPFGELPTQQPRPFFALLDRTLSNEIKKHIKREFWIDTVGQSRHVEVRVKHDAAVLRFIATRSQTYASNSHIFLMWMVGTSVVLLTVAILFMRNQIRPILRLAEAADAFGKGRPVPEDFRPRGAREVRQAAQAFVEMRERITQHVEQRTTMLAGVSHDLRTMLTRFKLELAFLPDDPGVRALKTDVNEMQHMLEDYLAFAKGDGGEVAQPTDVRDLLEEVHADTQHFGKPIELKLRRKQELVLPLKRNAFKRAITNLVSNAARFGDQIVIRAGTERQWLRIEVDDDGPGIPPDERSNVFKPFYRLDHARNQDEGNSGLGLAIARDIAKSHGGDVALGESSMGGLRAIIRVPL